MEIDFLVEGELDQAVASRLVMEVGFRTGVCYGKRGCGYLRKRAEGFAKYSEGANRRLLVLVDFMDLQLKCVGEVEEALIRASRANVVARACVPEVESWLLADIEGIADFLQVSRKIFPSEPEDLSDPKRELLLSARRSRNRGIRRAVVREGKEGAVGEGPEYNAELSRFVLDKWSVENGRKRSKSLERTLTKIRGWSTS